MKIIGPVQKQEIFNHEPHKIHELRILYQNKFVAFVRFVVFIFRFFNFETSSMEKRKQKSRNQVFCVLMLLVILIVPGCGNRRAITIGVPESNDAITVTEIYAQALEDAGYRVTRKYHNEGGDDNVPDILIGYTGTAVAYTDPGLVVLDQIPADNVWGLGMLRENAEGKGIDSLSDLKEKAEELILAVTRDFLDDPAGFPLLDTVYGPLTFKKTAIVSEDELHAPFHQGVVDVIPLHASDGYLFNPKHLLLWDDRHALTPLHAAPVVSRHYIEQDDQIRIILNSISKTLDDAEVIALNYKTAVQGIPPPKAAREYLKENGFLKKKKNF
jgi:osmoprotectant transport system substrate-binding protein